MNRDNVLLEGFILDHGSEAARLIDQLKIEQIVPFFNNMPIKLSIVLLQEMDSYSALKCLEEMEEEKSANILEKMPVSISAYFIRRMKEEKKEVILKKLEPQIAVSIEQMLYHLPGTTGAEMDPQVPVVPDNLNVKDTFERVKKSKMQSYEYIYVVNQERKLRGIVKLEDLIIADSKEQITNLLNEEIPRLYSEVDIDKIRNHPGWEEYNALPVVDRADIFLGALYYSKVRKSDTDKTKRIPRHAIAAGNALGELYRIGLSGLLHSTVSETETRRKKTTEDKL